MNEKLKGYIFLSENWFTPNTYDINFGSPPNKPGVYFIVQPIISEQSPFVHDFNVLYIGSASKLKQRYERHEVWRILKEVYGYLQFYYSENSDYLKFEKELIRKYKPKFNKKWL